MTHGRRGDTVYDERYTYARGQLGQLVEGAIRSRAACGENELAASHKLLRPNCSVPYLDAVNGAADVLLQQVCDANIVGPELIHKPCREAGLIAHQADRDEAELLPKASRHLCPAASDVFTATVDGSVDGPQ